MLKYKFYFEYMQVITRPENNILFCPNVSFNMYLLQYVSQYANMFRLYVPTSNHISCTSVLRAGFF